MPTKPTDTVVQIATDTNFSSSPVPAINGNPTKIPLVVPAEGLIPGNPAGSANLNWLFNTISKFVQWVKEGSNTADKDAHIVETDSDGVINTAGILSPAGTGYSISIQAINDSGGSARALSGTQTVDGWGVYGNQTGTSSAVRGVCSGTGGHGVYGSAVGTGAGAGVYGDALGASKAGVWATRSFENDTAALLVTGNNVAPVRGLVTIGVQSTEPSSAFLGDLYVSPGDFRIAAGGNWNTIGYRPEGWIDQIAYNNSGPLAIGVAWENIITISITPYRVGQIVIDCSVNCEDAIGTATAFQLRIRDATLGVTLITDIDNRTDGHRSLRVTYTLPNTVTRTLSLQGISIPSDVEVNFVTMTVAGIY